MLLAPVRAKRMLAWRSRRAARFWLDAAQKAQLQRLMWPDGKLRRRHRPVGAVIAERAGLAAIAERNPKILLVDEDGFGGPSIRSPARSRVVLTVYTARDFDDAMRIVERIYAYQGAGHSVGLHGSRRPARAWLGERLPVRASSSTRRTASPPAAASTTACRSRCRWAAAPGGRNNFSDNMNVRHYMNITRMSRPIPSACRARRDLRRVLRQVRAHDHRNAGAVRA